MATHSDSKRSHGARVATIARSQARAAKLAPASNLSKLAREIGATYKGN